MSDTVRTSRALDPATAPAPDARRWEALVFVALAQLMIVLDTTIVNIALPPAQADLMMSDGDRGWVITAYALAFGGLLLFGGSIANLWGFRRTFITGLIGFAAASVLGGAAVNAPMLFLSRALQGAFGALLAPAALSLLTMLFTDTKERAKAFGIFGAIGGGGGALGLILGGVLTDYLDWRWTFYVNVPIAAVAAIGAYLVIREPRHAGSGSRLDLPGVALSTLGLVSLVYGFTRAESDGWGAGTTVSLLAAAGVLLAAFVVVEARAKAPLLPLRVITDRTRAGTYLSFGLAVVGMFATFLFLTYYFQIVKGYTLVTAGLAFLPLMATMIIGSTQIGGRLMFRVQPRVLMTLGFLVAALGLLLLTLMEPGSSYLALVLPGEVLTGLGMGTAFMVAMNLATHGVDPRDAGVASAMANTAQQVGGAVGTALLNTIAAGATTAYLAAHHGTGTAQRHLAMVHGYTTAFTWAVAILAVAALLAALLIRTPAVGRGVKAAVTG
ncbi:MFS transporter [Streptomyces zaomyceticus]|uniref:MFS transporter n=1 Tax=Streptomyces zaomyceticus TaxID=68286 RepID=UPI00368DBF9D